MIKKHRRRRRRRKCNDLKCVRKPTKSRLSLTHHANKSSVEQNKTLNGPWVRGISPVGKEKVYGGNDLVKSQVLSSEWKTERVREDASGDREDGKEDDDDMPCVIGESEGGWTNIVRYLGIYLVSAKMFRRAIDNSKKSFYRSFNSIFGKVGRTASEHVTVELLKVKCLPVLLYGLEVCSLTKAQI